MSPSSCVVIVPVGGTIEPGCEAALDILEKRGYAVRRVFGFSAIDFGRSIMATHALADGFDELLWCDSDVTFEPDDVEKMRSHQLPIVAGICAKKTGKELACVFQPGQEKVNFGTSGMLYELFYAGFGFILTRRSVFDAIRAHFRLPDCNTRFGKLVVPYFLPMVVPDGTGFWYMSEDYSFCERAKQCGFKIMADTRLTLGHIGKYQFTWQDIYSKTIDKKAISTAPQDSTVTDSEPPPLLRPF